jgi:uncharacterized membrane-anchored protein YitT (DUF2179 family)
MYVLLKILVVFVGSLLLSIGINGFLVPHHLLDGGVEGIALILHYYFDYPTGVAVCFLGMPICLYAWFYDRSLFYNSFLGLFTASILIDWLEPLKTQFNFSIFPSVLLGGIFIGVGVGLMLRYRISTGGTDLLAQMISNSFSINVGVIILVIDGIIVTIAFYTMDLKTFLFSCLTIIIIGFITAIMAKSSNFH